MGEPNFVESSAPMVNSVMHATKILDYYASQHREYLSLTEISRAVGLHNETMVLSALHGDTGICVDLVKSKHNLGISGENGYIVPLPERIYTLSYSGPADRLRGLDDTVLAASLLQAVRNIRLKCNGLEKEAL